MHLQSISVQLEEFGPLYNYQKELGSQNTINSGMRYDKQIFEDNSSVLWLPSETHGVNIFQPEMMKFKLTSI